MSPYGGSLSFIMNTFTVTENFFSEDILNNIISKYSLWNPSKDIYVNGWHDSPNKDNPKQICCQDLSQSDRLLLIDFLYNSDKSIFKNFKPIKNASFKLVKAKPGYILYEHEDKCIASLTVFTDPAPKQDTDGAAFYVENGVKKLVNYKYNTAIQWKSLSEDLEINPPHGSIVNTTDRFTLQMFVSNNAGGFAYSSGNKYNM